MSRMMILDRVARPLGAKAAIWKGVLAACVCLVCLTKTRSTLADYVGIVSESKDDLTICQDDPDEPDIPYPLSVCNIYAAFDNPEDRLLSAGFR